MRPLWVLVVIAWAACASSSSGPARSGTSSGPLATRDAIAEAHVRRSGELCRSGRLRECVGELDEAIRLSGPTARLLTLRGSAKFQLSDYAGAAADYSGAIERDPKDGRVFLLRALSRSLLEPPDRPGACADLDAARKLGVAVRGSATGVDAWCKGG